MFRILTVSLTLDEKLWKQLEINKAQRVNALHKALAQIITSFLQNYSAINGVESLCGQSLHTEKCNFRLHIFKGLGKMY